MQFYTTNQTAKLLSVSSMTITRWREDGKFPHAKKNGNWRYPQCCVDDPSGKEHSRQVAEIINPELVKRSEAYNKAREAFDIAELETKTAALDARMPFEDYLQCCQDTIAKEAKLAEWQSRLEEKEADIEVNTVDESDREEFDDRVAGLDQWQELLEDLEDAIEVRGRAVDGEAASHSEIASDNHKMRENVKAMFQVIINLQRDITQKNKLDGWMERKARKRLDISIQENINTATKLYSEGHGYSVDKDGKLI